jgi:hypothetical protein
LNETTRVHHAARRAAVAWPLAARAQPVSRIFRIGFVGLPTADSLPKRPEAFRAGLRDLGYQEGGNIVMFASTPAAARPSRNGATGAGSANGRGSAIGTPPA